MSAIPDTRMAKQITFRVNDELERRLERYMNLDTHTFDPNRSDVVRKALDDFLPESEELDQLED